MILRIGNIAPTVSVGAQSVEKVKQKCLAFSLICGIINMVMKGAENRKTRKTSDRICMYGRADTGRPSAQKIDSVIDFTKIYEIVSDLYCENNGRPSIDPIVLFKWY